MSLIAGVYPGTARERDAWVLNMRGERNNVRAETPHACIDELEPDGRGHLLPTATIFLTNKECPFRCVMCDLWKNTLPEALPPGTIPAQIAKALEWLPFARQLKLYNSGSFFDPAAIPFEDHAKIAELVDDFDRVVVECHPAFLGQSAREFVRKIKPELEVAIGLETSDEHILALLNKRMTLDSFRRSAEFLRENGMTLRVFLMLAPPFLEPARILEQLAESVAFAFANCAEVVSIIPTRSGNGAMEVLLASGRYQPPTLLQIESALDSALKIAAGRGRVFIDLWDLNQFSSCSSCFEKRSARLYQINLQQKFLPRGQCDECGAL